jgi:hypothetical protein
VSESPNPPWVPALATQAAVQYANDLGLLCETMRRPLILALATMTVPFGVVGCGSTVDRDEYVKANENLFRQLPVFPGARLQREVSASYRSGEDGPIAGYTTLFDSKLPPDAQADVVASFFRQNLEPTWRLVERLDGPVLNFRKGRSSVSVNLESWQAHIVEIAVDHGH